MSDLADLMQDILGCVPGKGDRCLIHGNGWPCDEWVDAQSRVQELIDARESYTPEDIAEAYRKWSGLDDWGVPSFYESGLIAALRGEYDKAATS